MEKWMIRNVRAEIEKFASQMNISQVMARLLVNRNIFNSTEGEKFLRGSLDSIYNPFLLKDMDIAVKLINQHIENNSNILIVGDYDVDGVISTYVLYSALRELGAKVDYKIPDRINDGYGININIINTAKEMGVDLIITCDNGIAALEQVKLARELSMDIIVTDHHDIPFIEDDMGKRNYVIPEGNAIINPKRMDCEYPFKKLCGAAVAFKLIHGLMLENNLPMKEAFKYLEYVAIATVCDVVDLTDENRIIVKNGLAMINRTKNLGIKSLLRETNLEEKEISSYHLGFIIGPCINATGRLDSAVLAIKLLLSDKEEDARILAEKLHSLNIERQNITNKGIEKAVEEIESKNMHKDKVLVVYIPEIHESVAGIIAGRIRERYNLPTIVLTKAQEGIKGSGRSIEEYNMFEELVKCRDILNKFGGHPMAAGLSLSEENLESLRNRLNANCELKEEDFIPKVNIDMQLDFGGVDIKLAEELKILEPFGKGNTKPYFAEKGISILRAQVLGQNKNVLKLKLLCSKSRRILEGIYFGNIEEFINRVTDSYGKTQWDKILLGEENSVKIDIVYNIGINEYNGNRSLQITLVSYRI